MVVADLAVALRSRGHEPEVLSTRDRGSAAEYIEAWPALRAANIPLHVFSRVGPAPLCFSPGLELFLRRRLREFDVVNIHGIWGRSLGSTGRLARKLSVPYVVTVHGMLDRWSRRRSSSKKALARVLLGTDRMLGRASGLQYGTADEADEAAELRYPAPVYAIANGIDLMALAPGSSDASRDLLDRHPELAESWPIVLFFARIHPKKGLDLLVEGFAEVAAEFPRAALLVAGIKQDGAYQSRIENRIGELDLAGRIVLTTAFTGPKGRAALDAADVFALPSHEEGFSMSILEAMARELPVLVSDRCHLNDLESRGAGAIVPPTIPGVAGGLRKLLSCTQADLATMGRAGRAWVEAEFGREMIVDRIVAMYQDVIVRGRVAGARD